MEFGDLIVDTQFLRELHAVSPAMLDEMALPSFFHKNPLVRWVTHTRLRSALRFLDFKAGMQILDYGCGTGILFLQLPKGAAEYIGVDIHLWPAEKVLAHHQREDVRLLHADHWSGVVPDQSLDIIFATEVLEHIEDLGPLIDHFVRKLAPDGCLVISLPTENLLYKLGRKIAGFSGHYHRKDLPDILAAISAAGSLKFDSSASIPLPGPFCLYQIYRLTKTK